MSDNKPPTLDYARPIKYVWKGKLFWKIDTWSEGFAVIFFLIALSIWLVWICDVRYGNPRGVPGLHPELYSCLAPIHVPFTALLVLWCRQMKSAWFWAVAFPACLSASIYSSLCLLLLHGDPGHPQPKWRFENAIWIWIAAVFTFLVPVSFVGFLLSRKFQSSCND